VLELARRLRRRDRVLAREASGTLVLLDLHSGQYFSVAGTLRRGEPVDATRLADLARRQRCEGIVAATLLAVRATVGSPRATDLLGALRLGPVRGRALAGLVVAAVRWGSLDSAVGRLLAALLVGASMRPTDALRERATRRPSTERPGSLPWPVLTSRAHDFAP
jgi:hypothetical protein